MADIRAWRKTRQYPLTGQLAAKIAPLVAETYDADLCINHDDEIRNDLSCVKQFASDFGYFADAMTEEPQRQKFEFRYQRATTPEPPAQALRERLGDSAQAADPAANSVSARTPPRHIEYRPSLGAVFHLGKKLERVVTTWYFETLAPPTSQLRGWFGDAVPKKPAGKYEGIQPDGLIEAKDGMIRVRQETEIDTLFLEVKSLAEDFLVEHHMRLQGLSLPPKATKTVLEEKLIIDGKRRFNNMHPFLLQSGIYAFAYPVHEPEIGVTQLLILTTKGILQYFYFVDLQEKNHLKRTWEKTQLRLDQYQEIDKIVVQHQGAAQSKIDDAVIAMFRNKSWAMDDITVVWKTYRNLKDYVQEVSSASIDKVRILEEVEQKKRVSAPPKRYSFPFKTGDSSTKDWVAVESHLPSKRRQAAKSAEVANRPHKLDQNFSRPSLNKQN